MTNPNKQKGDRAEREVAAILSGLLGFNVRRQLGAGRLDDVGDLTGVPQTVVQVANRKDLATTLRVKPVECERQQVNAGAPFGFTAIRLAGGDWRAVLTLEQMATYIRETL